MFDEIVHQLQEISPASLAGAAVLIVGILFIARRKKPDTTTSAAKEDKKGGIDAQMRRFVAAGNYTSAARLAQKEGNHDAAIDYFLQAQEIARAAQLAHRINKISLAAELYERARDLPRAVALYRQAGMSQRADELAASINDRDISALSSSPSTESTPLQTPLDRAREAETSYRDAALRAERGDLDAKARLEELGRDAAESLLAAGDTRRAAEVCKDAGLIDQAINLFVNLLGDPGSAAPLLADRGDHRRAAELYEAAGLKERSSAAWIEWSEGADDPLECLDQVERLGKNAVMQLLDRVVERRPLDSSNVQLHYRIASEFEAHDMPQRALPLLETIEAREPNYRDINTRIPQLRIMVTQQAPAPRTSEASTRASQPTPPAETQDQTQDPPQNFGSVQGTALERLVEEVAASAAKEAVNLVRTRKPSGLLPAVEPIHVITHLHDDPRRKAGRALGLENTEFTFHYLDDPLVAAARNGASTGEILDQIKGQAATLENIELYYQLGLAQLAAGEWMAAQKTFATVETISPGYRDAAQRAEELERWHNAIQGSVYFAGNAQNPTEPQRFTLLGELGRGGMAVVYRARDEKLGREVALKFLADEVTANSKARELFDREAKAVAQLNHPNIVTVFDIGALEGRAYIAMELVTGTTVEDILVKCGRLKVLDALKIIENVLSALEYAHENRIIHRDIKLSNMMRSDLGVVKLMDFGLAKSMDGTQKTTIVAGTPNYMAPEQFCGKNVNEGSDLFAVGASLYEMLAGRPPFEGMRRDLEAPLLHTLNPTVPKMLSKIVQKSLEFDQETRYQAVSEMLAPIRHILAAAGTFISTHGGAANATPEQRPTHGASSTRLGYSAPEPRMPPSPAPEKYHPPQGPSGTLFHGSD